MEWDERQVQRLRALWDEGLSIAEIGRRLETSKNSVVGKAHRLDLPARPSPIRAPNGAQPPTVPRVYKRSLPPLPCIVAAPPRPPHQPPAPPQKAPEPPKPRRPPTACQWPLGEPGSKGFRLCGDPAADGYPYCATHCRVAYHNWPIRHTGHSLGIKGED